MLRSVPILSVIKNIKKNKVTLFLLLLASLIFSYITAVKDSIKIDEFITLRYIINGTIDNVDNQLLHMNIYKLWSNFAGISNLGLRSLNIILFVSMISIFFLWIKKNSENNNKAILICILFISNSYILEHLIYVSSYVFYFFSSLLTFIILQRITAKKEKETKRLLILLFLINLIGIHFHLLFYIIVIAQLLWIFPMRKDKAFFYFILFMSSFLVIHLVITGLEIYRFRSKPDMGGEALSFNFIIQSILGFVNWNGRNKREPLLLNYLVVMKGIIYISFVSLFIRAKSSLFSITRFYKILGVLCIFLYIFLKFLGYTEVDYRYFIFMEFVIVTELVYCLYSFRKQIRIIILTVLISVNFTSLYFYLSSSLHGNNEALLKKVHSLSYWKGEEIFYTDSVYYFKQSLYPLLRRRYPNIEFKITIKELNEIEKADKQKIKKVLLFEKRVSSPIKIIVDQFNVLLRNHLTCRNCDPDLNDITYLEILHK